MKCTRVVRTVRGHSDFRKNNCVLCRMTYTISNDYQLKKVSNKSDDFKNSIKYTAVFTLHGLKFDRTEFHIFTTSRNDKQLKGKPFTLFLVHNIKFQTLLMYFDRFIQYMFIPRFLKFFFIMYFVAYRRSFRSKPLSLPAAGNRAKYMPV